ncbi:flagellar export chaperone FliS [Paenibacillus sp.]|uniref:flagellar export chaperone FliS n=1 Tax=Paenibacillus sp. TaxID=58172 RepID=UPI002D3792E4|nr:flagellar export chaperone FliS [Paenibacillus sp.]HZG87406.1 flagellar export chaperone FliS [Paenibacillus sp.]
MMQQQQQNRYLEMTVQTANRGQLLILLYDGAIRFCKLAIEAIKERKLMDAHENLMKVQDIIHEFEITLDKNSPLANDLLRLYDYFLVRLREANMKKAAEPAEEVLGYLIELKQTWTEANKIAMASQAAAAKPQ